MSSPGDVVQCKFPGAQDKKPRPVVVISTDVYHNTRPDVIVGLLTTQLSAATAPSDYTLQDWAAAGLHKPSAFRAFLATIPAWGITRVIGHLTDRDWAEVQARLRVALAVT
jgi:mRNA interferase MazF